MIIDPYTWHTLQITAVTRLTPETLSVIVPRPTGYTFKAGQYAIVRVTSENTSYIRQYSFASSPQSDHLEFIVQREPGGTVSGWFHDSASAGDKIEVSQPFGDFTIKNPEQRHILIAGRAGIAPFLSMVRDQHLADMTILYSARGQEDFCYPELLMTSGALLIDSQAAAHITNEDLAPYAQLCSLFYLCGSKRFVDAMDALLVDLDVPADRVRRERFTLQ